MYKKLVLSALVAGSFLVVGCSSHEVIQSSSLAEQVDNPERRVVVDDVTMVSRAVYSIPDQEREFGHNLLEGDVMPVVVYFQNGGDKEVAINPESITLVSQDGTVLEPLSVPHLMELSEKSMWQSAGWALAFGIIGAAVSAHNVSETNERMEADFTNRLLKSKSLTKGRHTEGTLFYQLPESVKNLTGWQVQAVVNQKAADKLLTLKRDLHGELVRKKPEQQASTE